jgi:hypothetical protein
MSYLEVLLILNYNHVLVLITEPAHGWVRHLRNEVSGHVATLQRQTHPCLRRQKLAL